MKIAVLSDIHGNYESLQTVAEDIDRWSPDLVIVNGDMINRGPEPQKCLNYVKNRQLHDQWYVLRGNHEDYVVKVTLEPPQGKYHRQFHQPAIWTSHRVTGLAAYLQELPAALEFSGPQNTCIRVMHGSMHHNRDGIYPETKDCTVLDKISPAPDVFITAHTHRPLIRSVNRTLVVNSGSVGLPFDGNQQAAYAQIQWSSGMWHAEIVRLGYDIEKTKMAYQTNKFTEEAGPLTQIMAAELDRAASLLYGWVIQYQETVLTGELSIKASVSDYLSGL
jgi:putative phosphoesterase